MNMNDLKVGEMVFIESFKHDGSFHRAWSKALVIDKNTDRAVVVTDHSWVVESDGRRWLTKEPAVCFFSSKHWFNVISMIRKSGIYFYCNLASPSLYDGEAIKNIDYDLDIKVYPDHSYAILDENEYIMHASSMHYPDEIKKIIKNEMAILLDMICNEEEPFNSDYINDYLLKYFSMTIGKDGFI